MNPDVELTESVSLAIGVTLFALRHIWVCWLAHHDGHTGNGRCGWNHAG